MFQYKTNCRSGRVKSHDCAHKLWEVKFTLKLVNPVRLTTRRSLKINFNITLLFTISFLFQA
jgi:hypothetical protein